MHSIYTKSNEKKSEHNDNKLLNAPNITIYFYSGMYCKIERIYQKIKTNYSFFILYVIVIVCFC